MLCLVLALRLSTAGGMILLFLNARVYLYTVVSEIYVGFAEV